MKWVVTVSAIEKRKVTSAITTVQADDIKSIGVASIDQMLEGQVAGLMSTPTNGAPGAPAKMRIRSTVSLSGSTDPLWVLDGMILEGNDIPKDFGDKVISMNCEYFDRRG